MMSQQTDALASINGDPPRGAALRYREDFTPNWSLIVINGLRWDVWVNSQYIGSADCYREAARIATAAVANLPDEIEVDFDDSLYRVWQGMKLIGTFHCSRVDGKWLAYPTYSQDYQRHETSDEAQQAIVEAWQSAIRAM